MSEGVSEAWGGAWGKAGVAGGWVNMQHNTYLWEDAHGEVDEEEVEGVQGADVVEDVGVGLGEAEEGHQEVEPP